MENFKKLSMYDDSIKTTTSNSTDPLLGLDNVSNSLPNWWDLQIEQLKELEKVIEKRIKELESNDR
jgi:hypothetical protein